MSPPASLPCVQSVRPARRRLQPPGKDDRADGGEAGARHPVQDRNQHPRPPAPDAEMGRKRARRIAVHKVLPAKWYFAGAPLWSPQLRLPAFKIGRAHVWTPVTNAHLVCRLLLEKKKQASTR